MTLLRQLHQKLWGNNLGKYLFIHTLYITFKHNQFFDYVGYFTRNNKKSKLEFTF